MRQCILLLFVLFGSSFAQEIGARYLIVTPDDLFGVIQPLAQWKNRTGLRTKVVKLSQIGSSSAAIKAYVDNAYNTWPIQPEYLLLVGAPNYIPFFYFSAGSCYSDNYYTNMDADIYNEILSGRLNVHNITEAQTMVNKILSYEKTPDLEDSLWFINACLIVNEDYSTYPPPPYSDDSIYWSDIRHAKSWMLAHDYNTIDTLSDLLGNSASTVINRVNSGRAFVLYRGSATNVWYYPFSLDPNVTQNGSKLPIVLSITCGTLSGSSSPTTSEKWAYTGTATLPRGAAGYFATTTSGSNISPLRSAVCKGFFNALFGEKKQTFGEACEGGRLNVYNMYSSSSEYRGFTTIGDPSMRIWTAIPKRLDVYHDSALTVDAESLRVDVLCNDAPVDSALVCVLIDTTVYEYGYTENNGQIILRFDTLVQGSMHITVTADNKIPYLNSIPVGGTGVSEMTPAVEEIRSYVEVSPNPFTKLATVSFGIGHGAERMEINIFDASGRLVKSFYHGSGIVNRESVVSWNGRDDHDRQLPAGVYFVRLTANDEVNSVPVLLVR
ncbi:MAG: T9SS type A sorting domain-containing protein [candidate division WOR-3 bacterium]|nr:MAG: T9SS type A sorting domain-containing protein [candidate division WOR-3 bacterium]